MTTDLNTSFNIPSVQKETTTMVKLLYSSSVLLIVIQFALLSAEPCNEVGLFGTNCQYHCNCLEEKCDFTTGECEAGSNCEKGWFGPACQYVDLTTTEPGRTNPAWLYDGDDTTCIRNADSDGVTVVLAQPLPFTWLRLYVRDRGDQYSIQVQFKADSSSTDNTLVDCKNKQTASVDDKALNIHCDLDILVQEVILTGAGVGTLCSVYISGGRQVTLRQPTSQSSPAFGSNSFLAVDGDLSTDAEFCTSTGNDDTNPNWNVTFEQPQVINRLLLAYSQKENEYITHVLRFLDKRNQSLFEKQRYEEKTSVIYHITETNAVESVSAINVRVKAAPPSFKPLILCEVLAYGDTDCPQGKYGRECEHRCEKCLNEMCFTATGECPLGCVDGFLGGKCQTPCPPNYYGKNCEEKCSTNCKDSLCDKINGVCDECEAGKTGDQCDEECPPKKYGPNCELTCSSKCMDQLCHQVHGICLRCPPGFDGDNCDTPCPPTYYGKNCENKCSTSCIDSLCDKINGACDQCEAGKTGDQCDEECPPEKYGPNCELTCSSKCLDQLCHQVHGICLRCPPRYYGDSCDIPCKSGNNGKDCQQCHQVTGDCTDVEPTKAPVRPQPTNSTATDDVGPIVGAVVGAVVGVILVIVGVVVGFWFYKRKSNNDQRQNEQGLEDKQFGKKEEAKPKTENIYSSLPDLKA